MSQDELKNSLLKLSETQLRNESLEADIERYQREIDSNRRSISILVEEIIKAMSSAGRSTIIIPVKNRGIECHRIYRLMTKASGEKSLNQEDVPV